MKLSSRKTLFLVGSAGLLIVIGAVGWWFVWPRYLQMRRSPAEPRSQTQISDLDVLQARAARAMRNQQWSDAEAYYTRLVELQPDNDHYRFLRGSLRLTIARVSEDEHASDMGAAMADFREILRRSPDHFEARLYLAQCLLSDAKMAEAKEEFLVCHRLQPDRLEPILGLATCAIEDQDWNGAESLVRRALKLDPNSIMALSLQGDLSLRRQNYQQAIAAFSKVLKIDPNHRAANLKLAQAFRLSGRLEEAKAQERRFEALRH